jgi:hypothetical protein
MQVRTFTFTLRSGEYWCENGYTRMDEHIQNMIGGGWEVLNSTNDTGHVRVGKTLLVAGMTGGLSLLFGGSRTAKTITLTFKTDKPAPPQAPPVNNSDIVWTFVIVGGVVAALALALSRC